MPHRTVTRALYALRRHFGVVVTIHTRTITNVVDDFDQSQTVEATSNRARVVLLPVGYVVEEGLKGRRFSGDVKVGDREFLVDQKYPITIGGYIQYKSKRYDVLELADYEGEAYFVLARGVQDEPAV